jgi:hypothetical protein
MVCGVIGNGNHYALFELRPGKPADQSGSLSTSMPGSGTAGFFGPMNTARLVST